ncbi:FAD-dependent oxidoreductase [Saccharopolyspora taberi]|uniref:FAD-dependent monooxygenase n=1 Tax=Saccharopolyspora taberi TaxID=60895 RepID=A0ABN3V6I8_9PSEU
MGKHDQRPVLIVGAGPVGLTAALAVRAQGLPAVVLEADPVDRERPGSRALFVHRESLRHLEEMSPGLGTEINEHGVLWTSRSTYFRGRQVFSRTYAGAEFAGFPPFTSLRQVDTERFLRKYCHDAGVEFVWDSPVTSVRPQDDGVEVTVGDGGTWSAEYVIGADGARSAVRKSLGIKLEGDRAEGFHVVVDIRDDSPSRSLERVLHYEHPELGGRTVLFVPFAGGFQVDLQCRESDSAEEFATTGGVREWLGKVLPERHRDNVLWVSKYTFQQVVANTFTDEHRRVLLVGEAAHLFPPFGARGLNSGIADAAAAAGAIRAGLDSGRRDAVAEFDRDRRDAALFNRDAAAEALRQLRPQPGRRFKQLAAARFAPLLPSLGRWLENAPYGAKTGRAQSSRGRY